jgi:hypothetical protein
MFHSLNFLIPCWLILTAGLFPLLQPEGQARLFLQPVPLQDDRLLVINLLVADVTNLYGAEIQLGFDPAQLKVRDDNPRLAGVQAAPGPLLAFDDRFVASNQADNQAGQVDFVFTLLRPAPPIAGQGVLATVVFEITGRGPFDITVEHAQLVSAESTPLPAVVEGLRMPAASVANMGPGLAAAPAWLWWAGGALLVGLVGVSGLLVWLHTRPPRVGLPPEAMPEMVRVQPGQGQAAVQSAALLAEQGHRQLQQGKIQAAYELFNQALEVDPANVAAWLGKGLSSRSQTERRICLERVLALEPANQVARRELHL